MSTPPQNVICVGLEPELIAQVRALWPVQGEIIELKTAKDIEDLIENPNKYSFRIAICGSQLESTDPSEVAQVFRVQFTHAPVYFMTTDREKFSRKKFLDNGFHEVFISPFDESVVSTEFKQVLGLADEINTQKFVPVRLVDLEPDTILDFHVWVYLPVNKKHVRFIAAGQKTTKERLDKLRSHDVSSIFLIREDLPKFYKSTVDKLKNLSENISNLTETEKRERLQGAIRQLFASIFDQGEAGSLASGRAMRDHCQKIVGEYLFDDKKQKWFAKIKNAIADSDNTYSHSLSVSTFAAMFSIGTQLGKAEDLAIAGLFHDVGLVDIPKAIQVKKDSERTPEEQAIYEKHPETTLKIIKDRKIILNDNAVKAISEHHERYDGKGYPNKRTGARISIDGQLLSFADKFDYLTRIEPGKPYSSPQAAVAILKADGAFSPSLISHIEALLQK